MSAPSIIVLGAGGLMFAVALAAVGAAWARRTPLAWSAFVLTAIPLVVLVLLLAGVVAIEAIVARLGTWTVLWAILTARALATAYVVTMVALARSDRVCSPRRSRRTMWGAQLAVVGAVALLVIGVVLRDGETRAALDARRAAMRQRGATVRPVAPPADRDAAPLYAEAAALLEATDDERLENWGAEFLDGRLLPTEEAIAAIDDLLRRTSGAMTLIATATARPEFGGLDPGSVHYTRAFAELHQARSLALLIHAHALVAAARGDEAAATAHLHELDVLCSAPPSIPR